MHASPLSAVTQSDIDSFERDGAVCLRQMFAPEWLDDLAGAIEETMASSGPYTKTQSNPGDPGFYFSDYWASHRVGRLASFALNSPAAEIAATVLRSERANFFFDAVWVKEPLTRHRSAWHQDQPYYCVNGRQICILWLPIDPVAEDVSLRCVRGSHGSGAMYDPVFFKDGSSGYGRNEASAYPPIPDIDAHPETFEVLRWELDPGDCIVFHGLTIHGAPGNPSSERRRRAVSTTWLGDDTTYIERPGMMEPHIEDSGLADGDSLDCAHFPRVWPRDPQRREG